MSKRQPYSELNLPSHHLPIDSEHAKPASARQPAEIYFRRSRRTGALVLDQQRKGLVIAGEMANILAFRDVDDGGFSINMLAMASVNTSFYSFANGARVMDRKLDLPQLVTELDDGVLVQASEEELLFRAAESMDEAYSQGTLLYSAFEKRREGTTLNRRLGKNLGNSSLLLASVSQVETVAGLGAFDAQVVVRDHLLTMLEDARTIAAKPLYGHDPMGRHPSLMRLPDNDSEINVYWRTNGPNAAVELLEEAKAAAEAVEKANQ